MLRTEYPTFSQASLEFCTNINQSTSEGVNRSGKAAPLPEGTEEMENHHWYSGMGSRGHPESGSGKGGQEPKTQGEGKELGGGRTSKNAGVAPLK